MIHTVCNLTFAVFKDLQLSIAVGELFLTVSKLSLAVSVCCIAFSQLFFAFFNLYQTVFILFQLCMSVFHICIEPAGEVGNIGRNLQTNAADNRSNNAYKPFLESGEAGCGSKTGITPLDVLLYIGHNRIDLLQQSFAFVVFVGVFSNLLLAVGELSFTVCQLCSTISKLSSAVCQLNKTIFILFYTIGIRGLIFHELCQTVTGHFDAFFGLITICRLVVLNIQNVLESAVDGQQAEYAGCDEAETKDSTK